MDDKTMALIAEGSGELLSFLLKNRNDSRYRGKPQVSTVTVTRIPQPKGVSTEETIAYQKREVSKELLLLEKHLQQGCKIGGRACDCCEKHPIAIEALSQEALGMTGDTVFNDIVEFTKRISPMTSADAATSGQYAETYPKMAMEARELRKRVMGTTDIRALLEPAERERVDKAVGALLEQTNP
jgi:hypothetical protein